MADGHTARRSRNSCRWRRPARSPRRDRCGCHRRFPHPAPITTPGANSTSCAQARLGRNRLGLQSSAAGNVPDRTSPRWRRKPAHRATSSRTMPAGASGRLPASVKWRRHQTGAGARGRESFAQGHGAGKECQMLGAAPARSARSCTAYRHRRRREQRCPLFANLRQGERPKIFEKAGIGHFSLGRGGHGLPRPARRVHVDLEGRHLLVQPVDDIPVMSKPPARGADTTACLSSTMLAPRSFTSCCRIGPERAFHRLARLVKGGLELLILAAGPRLSASPHALEMQRRVSGLDVGRQDGHLLLQVACPSFCSARPCACRSRLAWSA